METGLKPREDQEKSVSRCCWRSMMGEKARSTVQIRHDRGWRKEGGRAGIVNRKIRAGHFCHVEEEHIVAPFFSKNSRNFAHVWPEPPTDSASSFPFLLKTSNAGAKERGNGGVISKLCYPSNFFCARPVVDDTKHHPLRKLIFLKKIPAGRCLEEGDCVSPSSNDSSLLFLSNCLLSLISSFARPTVRNKINA